MREASISEITILAIDLAKNSFRVCRVLSDGVVVFNRAIAIAEAASRPSMSFVAMKSAKKQGRAVAFLTHQCFVRQRTQLINALWGHLAEFGLVAPKGPIHLKLLHTVFRGQRLIWPRRCWKWVRST